MVKDAEDLFGTDLEFLETALVLEEVVHEFKMRDILVLIRRLLDVEFLPQLAFDLRFSCLENLPDLSVFFSHVCWPLVELDSVVEGFLKF